MSKELGQLASRFIDSERQRAEETATVAAVQAAQKAEGERRKGQEAPEWNARMSSLRPVQISIRGKVGYYYYCCRRSSTAEEKKQEQGEATGYVQRTGPSGGPGFRRELARRGLLGAG